MLQGMEGASLARLASQVVSRISPPGKGHSNSHGARPVHLIITMIKWIRTSRLSINSSLSGEQVKAGTPLEHSPDGRWGEPGWGVHPTPYTLNLWRQVTRGCAPRGG